MAKNISKKTKESFANAETLAELKSVFVNAMCKYHTQAHKDEVTALYEKYFDEVKTWNKNKDGELYEKATDEVAKTFTDALSFLTAQEGVNLEMCGSWLWISDAEGFEGTTKALNEELKNIGCRYAPNKQNWYIAPPNARRSRRHYSMDEIRAMHGSEEVEA